MNFSPALIATFAAMLLAGLMLVWALMERARANRAEARALSGVETDIEHRGGMREGAH